MTVCPSAGGGSDLRKVSAMSGSNKSLEDPTNIVVLSLVWSFGLSAPPATLVLPAAVHCWQWWKMGGPAREKRRVERQQLQIERERRQAIEAEVEDRQRQRELEQQV